MGPGAPLRPKGAVHLARPGMPRYKPPHMARGKGEVMESCQREPPLSAVIFDVDGTLLDSEENYYLADRRLLERYGIEFTREEKRRYVGTGNRDMMADIKRRYGISESAEELVTQKNSIYLEIAAQDTRVYPEVARLVYLLRSEGIPIAAASGSSPQVLRLLLASVGLAGELGAIVSAEEVKSGKPSPDIFVEAARRLGVPAQECVAIEDSQYGVEAAKRASMRCIAIPYLAEPPLPDSFGMADLLFAGGMSDFSAVVAFCWIQQFVRSTAN